MGKRPALYPEYTLSSTPESEMVETEDSSASTSSRKRTRTISNEITEYCRHAKEHNDKMYQLKIQSELRRAAYMARKEEAMMEIIDQMKMQTELAKKNSAL